MDLVSVIIPVYNVENYIDDCVESVLQQTHENIEVLLIDDGSTDQSAEKCKKWAARDSRIRVVHQDNQGLSGARNTGIKESKGNWITFVDSDDIVASQYVETMVHMGRSNQVNLVQCGYTHFSEKKPSFDNLSKLVEPQIVSSKAFMLSRDYRTMAWAKLYDRELFQHEIFPVGKLHEDNAIVYKLVYEAKRVAYTNEILYGYRIRENSIVGEKGYSLRHLDKKDFLKERVDYFFENNEKELVTLARKEYAFELLEAYGKVKKYHSSQKLVLRELKQEYRGVADEVMATEALSRKTVMLMKMAKHTPSIWMKVFGEK